MLKTARHVLELIRFSHTVFALPFAMLAAVMAWRLQYLTEIVRSKLVEGKDQLDVALEFMTDYAGAWYGGTHDLEKWRGFTIRWQEFVGIIICMVAARSAAMALNRLADRDLDALNPRTAGRHLPAKILSVTGVRLVAIGSMAFFMLGTLLFLPNRLPLYLALPVLALLAGYSYTKRFTSLAHFWLGAALGLSPVAAWIAIRGDVVLSHPADLLPALVLGAAVMAWVAGFDIIYACQDYDADRSAGLHSVPVRLGIAGSLRLAAACHAATVALLAVLPLVYPWLGWVYWAGIAAVAALLVYEHALVRPDDLTRVNKAFFQVNAVISLGLFAVSTLDLMLGGR